jgi:hypothetical protein
VLTPFPVESFGGLNLFADSTDVGMSGAVTATDVMVDRPGQIRTRDGYTARATTSTAPRRCFIHTTTSLSQLLTSSSTKLEAFDTGTGASVASVAATGTRAHAFVTTGTSSTTVVYVTAALDTTVRKWDGAAWSAIAAAPIGRTITFTHTNRLVIAGHGNGHRVQFSDPGAPETWPSTNWTDITPGDGEIIDQLVRWQNLMFAFKQTKYAVFLSESTLSDGTPVFNYRMVNGIGCLQGVGRACASPTGVYFMALGGIYKTTGGEPIEVSGAIRTLFTGNYLSSTENHLCWNNGRLYAVIQQAGGPTVLVYDERTGTWTTWSIMSGKAGGGLAADPLGDLAFVNGTDTTVFLISPNLTTDNGTAISWSYTTGYSDAGGYNRNRVVASPQRKKHFAVDVLGAATGSITHQVLALNARPNDVADPGGTLALGTYPAIARGRRRRAARGTHFAHALSGSGPVTIDGFTYFLSEIGQDT